MDALRVDLARIIDDRSKWAARDTDVDETLTRLCLQVGAKPAAEAAALAEHIRRIAEGNVDEAGSMDAYIGRFAVHAELMKLSDMHNLVCAVPAAPPRKRLASHLTGQMKEITLGHHATLHKINAEWRSRPVIDPYYGCITASDAAAIPDPAQGGNNCAVFKLPENVGLQLDLAGADARVATAINAIRALMPLLYTPEKGFGLVIAGGFVQAQLFNSPVDSSDIDAFIVCRTDVEYKRLLAEVRLVIQPAYPITTYSASETDFVINDGFSDLQIVKAPYPTPSAIVYAFDLPNVACLVDGTGVVRLTPGCLYAHANRVIAVDPLMDDGRRFTNRLLKHAVRLGYDIAAPGISAAQADTVIRILQDLMGNLPKPVVKRSGCWSAEPGEVIDRVADPVTPRLICAVVKVAEAEITGLARFLLWWSIAMRDFPRELIQTWTYDASDRYDGRLEDARRDRRESAGLLYDADLYARFDRAAVRGFYFIGFHGNPQSGEPGCDWADSSLSRLLPCVQQLVLEINASYNEMQDTRMVD
jgi:hypothetical protein